MQVKGSASDVFRVSVSSAPSTSSHGSAPDDCDALGDVYIWGEVTCENVKVGADKNVNYVSPRADVLLPRPLESSVVLDVHHIACGVRHASLVTRQECGSTSSSEALTSTTVDFVACGEFHSCAVTMAGELYTWGDGTHNAGLLGHGSDVSHWIPKRIAGPLEGLQIAFVACGPWHTALVTSTGQLFTFGDGTFGVLGHGDRQNVSYPREVESLLGLRTIAVACGVCHTAAVVEVIATHSSTSISSGLTKSGCVFTMGSTVYGQLGNPQSDGKVPCLVGDKIARESIEEIACGAYHVAVLTSKMKFILGGKVQMGDWVMEILKIVKHRLWLKH
ncbi:hypothetical protein JHK84_045748 [Glycine max]|nr:hypothetical protein JHK84_045748 [Glycine max]